MKINDKAYTNLFREQMELYDSFFNDILSIMKDHLKPNEELCLYEFYPDDHFDEVYYRTYNDKGEKVLSVVGSVLYNEKDEIVFWYNDSIDKDKIWENIYDYDLLSSLYKFLVTLYDIKLE